MQEPNGGVVDTSRGGGIYGRHGALAIGFSMLIDSVGVSLCAGNALMKRDKMLKNQHGGERHGALALGAFGLTS
jgi:hypothetical protein